MNLKLRQHTTLYEKYKLFGEISIRYFYHFKDNSNLEGKWILKDHKTKLFTKLNENMVITLFESYFDQFGKFPEKEIIHGYLDPETDEYIHTKLI